MDATLRPTNFYKDRHFAIALWEGNRGDYLRVHIPEPTLRKDTFFFSVCVRGSLRMLTPSGELAWTCDEGMTSLEGCDFPTTGYHTWEALKDDTQELCISALEPETGAVTEEPFEQKVFDVAKGQSVVIPGQSLIVVCRGAFDTKINMADPILTAPHFSRVDTSLTLYGMNDVNRVAMVRR